MSKHREVMASPFAGDPYTEDNSSPMDSLSNLADAMLVIVCGLMVALVLHWNVDIAQQGTEVAETGDMTQVEGDVQSGQMESSDGSGSTYEEMGKLYKDTKTGQLYYLTE